MPQGANLVHRLADLRRRYTGETASSVNPEMAFAITRLTADERKQLDHGCQRDYSGRVLGEDSAPSLPQHVRAAVLPDATTASQQALEAKILRAVSRSMAHLDHPAAAVGHWLTNRPGRVLRMVRPRPDEFLLHVDAAALPALLFELLPRITSDGELVGVPGLRARLNRRSAVLYMLGSSAKVGLAGLTYRQWLAALAFAEHVELAGDPLRWMGNDPTPLRAEELVAMARPSPELSVAALHSALLRRFGIFAPASGVSVRHAGLGETGIVWRETPTTVEVAVKLLHPVAGLPNDRFLVVPRHDRVRITSIESGVELLLALDGVGKPTPALLGSPEVAGRWSAWSSVMSRLNPTWPSSVGAGGRVLEAYGWAG